MRRMLLLIFFNALFSVALHAQFQKDAPVPVYAEGKIFNHDTKEPIVATITYQSEPYGNKVGLLKGNSYSIALYDNEKYSIVVEAPGFAPAKYLLDPGAANADKKVIQDVALGLPPTVAKEPEIVHHVGKVIRLQNLIFQQRSAIISPESYPELNDVGQMMHTNPKMVIQLEGHTDTRGDAKLNLKLSQQRVDAVRDYLIKRGVSKSRVKTKAFGGTMPLSKENTEEAHKLNRRVEARVLEN